MRKFSDLFYQLLLCALVSALLSFNIGLAAADDGSECTVTDQSDDVILVVCPPDLTQEAWKEAGEEACASNNGICNVWIWDNIAKAPQEAPATDSEMSKESTRQALAIWVNDAKRLIILGKVE